MGDSDGGQPATGNDETAQPLVFLLGLIGKIAALDPQQFFMHPVDGKLVPGYYDKIKQPMCFQVMKNKLAGREYRTWRSFVSDFELICNNARTFNPTTHKIHKLATSVLRSGKKLLQANELLGRRCLYNLHPQGPKVAAAEEDAQILNLKDDGRSSAKMGTTSVDADERSQDVDGGVVDGRGQPPDPATLPPPPDEDWSSGGALWDAATDQLLPDLVESRSLFRLAPDASVDAFVQQLRQSVQLLRFSGSAAAAAEHGGEAVAAGAAGAGAAQPQDAADASEAEQAAQPRPHQAWRLQRSGRSAEWKQARRSIEWRCRWLELRLRELGQLVALMQQAQGGAAPSPGAGAAGADAGAADAGDAAPALAANVYGVLLRQQLELFSRPAIAGSDWFVRHAASSAPVAEADRAAAALAGAKRLLPQPLLGEQHPDVAGREGKRQRCSEAAAPLPSTPSDSTAVAATAAGADDGGGATAAGAAPTGATAAVKQLEQYPAAGEAQPSQPAPPSPAPSTGGAPSVQAAQDPGGAPNVTATASIAPAAAGAAAPAQAPPGSMADGSTNDTAGRAAAASAPRTPLAAPPVPAWAATTAGAACESAAFDPRACECDAAVLFGGCDLVEARLLEVRLRLASAFNIDASAFCPGGPRTGSYAAVRLGGGKRLVRGGAGGASAGGGLPGSASRLLARNDSVVSLKRRRGDDDGGVTSPSASGVLLRPLERQGTAIYVPPVRELEAGELAARHAALFDWSAALSGAQGSALGGVRLPPPPKEVAAALAGLDEGSSSEDTSDEAYAVRHHAMEAEERVRLMGAPAAP